jgi:hypothetical protein
MTRRGGGGGEVQIRKKKKESNNRPAAAVSNITTLCLHVIGQCKKIALGNKILILRQS